MLLGTVDDVIVSAPMELYQVAKEIWQKCDKVSVMISEMPWHEIKAQHVHTGNSIQAQKHKREKKKGIPVLIRMSEPLLQVGIATCETMAHEMNACSANLLTANTSISIASHFKSIKQT